jgi:GT2 family glycosyltransferase
VGVRRAFVVVATRDLELLTICKAALARHTPAERLHLVVVDGFPPGAPPRLLEAALYEQRPRPTAVTPVVSGAADAVRIYGRATYGTLVHLGARQAYAGNAGVEGPWFPSAGARDEDLLVFCNDDAVVMPGWLEQVEAELDALEELGLRPGLLGARSNHVSGPQCSLSPPPPWRSPFPVGAHPATDPRLAGVFPWPRIVSFFCATRVAAYRDAGGFDTTNPAHQWADDALSVRMLRTGRSNFVSGAFVAHFGSQTFRALAAKASAPAERIFDEDLELGRRWFEGAYPDARELLEGERRRWYDGI